MLPVLPIPISTMLWVRQDGQRGIAASAGDVCTAAVHGRQRVWLAQAF